MREVRQSSDEILICRCIDRPMRPLFPEGYMYETQIIATVLSADRAGSPDVISLIGASAAVHLTSIPFNGPIGGVRVGRVGGKLIANPTVVLLVVCVFFFLLVVLVVCFVLVV